MRLLTGARFAFIHDANTERFADIRIGSAATWSGMVPDASTTQLEESIGREEGQWVAAEAARQRSGRSCLG